MDVPATIILTSPDFADGTPGRRQFHCRTTGIRVIPTRLGKDGYSGPENASTVRGLPSLLAGHVLARGILTGIYER